jgi:hypothetical protein
MSQFPIIYLGFLWLFSGTHKLFLQYLLQQQNEVIYLFVTLDWDILHRELFTMDCHTDLRTMSWEFLAANPETE